MLADDIAPFKQAQYKEEHEADAEAETVGLAEEQSEHGSNHHIIEEEPSFSSSRSTSTSTTWGSIKRMREADEDQYYGSAELEDEEEHIWATNSVSERLESMTQKLGEQNELLRNVLATLQHHSNVLCSSVDALLSFIITAAPRPPLSTGGVSPASSGFSSWRWPASSVGSVLPRLAKRARLSLGLQRKNWPWPWPPLWRPSIQKHLSEIDNVPLLQVLALPALVLVVVFRYLSSSFSSSSSSS